MTVPAADTVSALKLERYKYILSQKQALNAATFRVTAIFQSLTLAILAGALWVHERWSEDKLAAGTAAQLSEVILWVYLGICLFAVLGMLSNLTTWLKYKREELALEQEFGLPARPDVRWRDAFRWIETYVIVLILISAIGLPWAVSHHLLSLYR